MIARVEGAAGARNKYVRYQNDSSNTHYFRLVAIQEFELHIESTYRRSRKTTKTLRAQTVYTWECKKSAQ